jgi:plasmid stabilization system protein ParE
VSRYRLEAEPAVEFDVAGAFEWYEAEEPGLGFAFLDQLRAAYGRILETPLAYQKLRSGIRRILTREFPYAVFFSIEGDIILVLAVLHTARDPAEWQGRI